MHHDWIFVLDLVLHISWIVFTECDIYICLFLFIVETVFMHICI